MIKIKDHVGVPQSIYSVTFIDGPRLVAAASNELLVFSKDGSLLKRLNAHKDLVYALAPLSNGGFASGGADKQVIIWDGNLQGVLKYSHGDSIQSLSVSPVSNVICSCTASDFGLWSAEIKKVDKHKVSNRIVSSDWSKDGQMIALGMYNGQVSVRSSTGLEKYRIDRKSTVWALKWIQTSGNEQLLVVTDWSQKFVIFDVSGKQVGREAFLGYDCLSIQQWNDKLILSGSDSKVSLYTLNGVMISQISHHTSWVWAAAIDGNCIASACHDGTVSVTQVQLNPVSHVYYDRHAYSQDICNVVIQNLITKQKQLVKSNDIVQLLSIYKDHLAVKYKETIVIYEIFHDDNGQLLYRLKEKMDFNAKCSNMAVTWCNLILFFDSKVEAYGFDGIKQREWQLNSPVNCFKCIGGPKGKEGILLGLNNGSVVKIFMSNPFPVQILKHNHPISSIDSSFCRKYFAFSDSDNIAHVYKSNKQHLFSQQNVKNVSFNGDMDEMVCFLYDNLLTIKILDLEAESCEIEGMFAGVFGSNAYCLVNGQIENKELPLILFMDQYIQKKDYQSSYNIACLDVPDYAWKKLSFAALENGNIQIARQGFAKIQKFKYLEGISGLEKISDPNLLKARIALLSNDYNKVFEFDVGLQFFSQVCQSAIVY
jgi:intraflagellar transport protein 122